MKHSVRRTSAVLPALMALVLSTVLLGGLAGCGSPVSAASVLNLATYLPLTGPEGTVGLAMQRGVDLAVKQNADVGKGYTLSALHFDTLSDDPASVAAMLSGNPQVVGLIGPTTGSAAQPMLASLAHGDLLTMSLGPLPSTLAAPAPAAPQGSSGASAKLPKTVLLRLAPSDDATGTLAADVAVRGTQDQGLGAHTVYVVDDGTVSGKAMASAFTQELGTRGGSVAGHQSLTLGAAGNAQAITSAIIDAYPDLIFYGGSLAGASTLRATLAQTGAGSLPFLVAGPSAGDPDWATLIGNPQLAGNTTGILAAPHLATSTSAKTFTSAYAAAYPNQPLLPESAMAYDAAMDEITAIKGLLAKGQSVTHASVLAAVASGSYAGVTGTLAFTSAGTLTHPLGWSLYTVNAKGAWQYVAALQG